MTNDVPWTVTRADRDAAAGVLGFGSWGLLLDIGFGRDRMAAAEYAKRFARHRHEATAPLVEALEEARGELAMLYEVSGFISTTVLIAKIDPLLTQHKGTDHAE